MPFFKRKQPGKQTTALRRSESASGFSDTYENTSIGTQPRSEASNRRDKQMTKLRDSLPEDCLDSFSSEPNDKEDKATDTLQESETLGELTYCEPCIEGQKENTAVGLCKDCSEHLCDECYRTHKNHKSFRNHVLQVLDGISRDSSSQNEITIEDGPETVVEDICTNHDEPKIYEYYCKSCDQLACSICMFKQHRSCQQVELIEDVIKTFQDSSECKEFTEDLEKLKAGFATCDNTIKTSMANNEVRRVNARISLSIQVEKISEQLIEAEKNIKSKICNKFDKEQKEINEMNKKHEEWHRQIKIINTQIEHCRNSGHINLLFIYIKKARELIDNLKEDVQEMNKDIKIKRYGIEVKDLTEDFKTLFQLTDEQGMLEDGSDEADYLSMNM